MTWEHLLVYIVAGAFGGLVRLLVTGKGILVLPTVQVVPGGSPHLNLGFLAPMIIGAAAGLVSPYTLGVNGVFSILSGYVGADGIENLIERYLERKSKASVPAPEPELPT